ncbi:MAG: hypothetical protein JW819_06630 [Candidatus Krumholzibacteriota bacterium]|nr:hypothetical protein [Candidatus Krumholzibacteriota bacterium]
MRSTQLIMRLLPLVLVIGLVIAGCSDQPLGPMDPAGDGPAAGPITVRSDSLYDYYYKESVHDDYTTISEVIAGTVGGMVKGVVSGYADTFRIDVPAGAFAYAREIRIDVPTSHVPVFQLFPSGTFDDAIAVTLDTKLWLDDGTLVHGEEYEVFHMNPATETLDVLSPRAVFTADSTATTMTFTTTHFSRWTIGGAIGN